MLNVSNDFLTAIDAPSRTFHLFMELFVSEGITPSASCSSGTNVDNVCDGLFRPTDYNSVGSVVKTPAPGWRGANISDANGRIVPEVITINYSPSVKSKNLWVIGRRSNYPVDFVVEIKENNAWSTVITVTNNTSWDWFLQLDSERTIQAFRLTISKISTDETTALVTECGVIYKLLLGDEDVQDASVLAEASIESRNPVGVVTSNEFTAGINNEDQWYTITSDGPLSGLIYPGIKVVYHIGVKIPNGSYEFVKVGTFYVTDWSAPSVSIVASMTANDRLLKLMDLPAQNKMPIQKVAVKALFEYLFASIGLTPDEYVIDASLNRVINVGWIPADKVGAVLQEYSIAGMCAVFVTSDDRIRVADLMATVVPALTFTQDNQLKSFDNNQGFSNIYSSVEINYKTPRLSEFKQVLSIENIEIPTGISQIAKATFSNPVGVVSYASLLGAVTTSVVDMSYGTQAIDLTVNNIGNAAETITLVVYGYEIEGDGATATVLDQKLYSTWPDKVLSIDSDFIQNQHDAEVYASSIIKLAANPQAIYNISARGNPAVEIMDTIKLQGGDLIKVARDFTAVVIRHELTYDGGLSAQMVLRDPLV